jgi:hypothetical protein
MPAFALKKVTGQGYDEVLGRMPELLKAEGFGVLNDGGAVVLAMDPVQAIGATSPAVRPIAEEVRARLARVLDRVG